ncbi:glucokinase [Teredinibacter turnerae]|uniref:Glucokinase n=1 Tax=Teredinibacter turnerae (strain ATCC 39867 / T7901) TaxID=377629 RepID=C5BNE2_TERTT|nr:glucokinase [Teredinibacter turnerae]ACR13360.1 glucokinase [Teredinibacter turnerae T7901]
MFPSIVADIGGTNARFALVTGTENGQFVIENIQILNGAEYEGFADALRAYMDSLGSLKPFSACVAIAGPIAGDSVQMTNLSWSFTQSGIRKAFGFEKFAVINDFGALAVATSALNPTDLVSVKGGSRNPEGNKAIMGPGTGLGVAGLAYTGSNWLPIPSEGGHVNIAPASALECEVIKAAIATHGHVSAETFISGPGLVNLYRALCEVNGVSPRELQPKDITADAMSAADQTCVYTLNLFCSFLGTVAGNLALTYGASGGVYLAGGILPRMLDFLKDSDFKSRFSNKGVMSHYVDDIPVDIIAHPQTAFLGAATWLAQL